MKHSESDISLSTAADADTPEYRKYQVRKSKLIGLISWTHVIGTYIPQFILCGLGVLVALIFNQVIVDLMKKEHIARDFDVTSLPTTIMATFAAIADLLVRQVNSIMGLRKEALFSPAVEGTVLALIIMVWMICSDNPTYLLSFATFKAPESWRASHDEIIEMMRRQEVFTQDSLDFMRRLLDRSGTGQRTAWPPGIIRSLHEKDENGKPLKSDRTIAGSRHEAHTVIFDIVEKAMKKANITPQEVDVLVINCSLFSPTPSLCAAVIAHFQMRGDILSYNLSGMGCGASLLALDLGKNMLQRRKWGGKALVVSTEVITPNLYLGNERGFLVQNTLFRCGGSAMVISNKWMDGSRAWFKLLHSVRVQSTNEDGYQCVFETEDGDGVRGVRLSKDIVKVAGKTMEKNLTRLGPYVLPLSEQAKVAISLIAKFVMKTLGKIVGKKLASVKIYVPDFKRGIDHFCIHAGGRAVIDGIEKNMKLQKYHTEPSRMTLMNYGNTSSSSIWYELEYIMEHQKNNPLKKGDRVMQVAFGSGFKCCSGVWLKL